jgi:RNA polymerase sigma factor (sigma-70 family)
MDGSLMRDVIRGLRRVVGPAGAAGVADADLLGRWVADRDEAAFELLLWRHGPTVLGLCRRLLRRPQDVEDAFQATFLALVRKAAAIRKPEAVGSWLYRVAYRAALQLRAGAARRQTQDPGHLDRLAAAPGEDPLRGDLRALLDEEVSRLPEHYRAPFVLCYFEGKTNAEAARELGRPVGTVVSRLARARERLRARLARRGLALSAGALAAAGEGEAAAAPVPAALARTVLAALRPAAGGAPARAALLAERTLRAMSMSKLQARAALLLAAVLAIVGAGALARPAPARDDAAPATKPARPDVESDEAVALRWRFEKGTPFYLKLTTNTRQVLRFKTRAQEQNQKQTFYFRFTPYKQSGRIWQIKQKIERVVMDLDLGDTTARCDTSRPAGRGGSLDAFYRALVGPEVTLTLDTRSMKITRVDGLPALRRKVRAAVGPVGPFLWRQLGADAFAAAVAPVFAAVPGRDVNQGERWQRRGVLVGGQAGTWWTTYTYTLAAGDPKKPGQARIRAAVALRWQPPAAGAEDAPFKIDRPDKIKAGGGGTVLFNLRKRRLERWTLRTSIRGDVEIDVADKPTRANLSQAQETTAEITDDDPLARKR